MADRKKSMVLSTSPRRLSINTSAAAAGVQATTATADARGTPAPTSRHCTATGTHFHDILPLRLQCRILQLESRMAGRQKGILLPDSSEGMRATTTATTRAGGHHIPALRLQRRLSRLLPLLGEAMECWKACLVLSAHAAWLPNDRSCSLDFFAYRRDARMHGGMMAHD